MLDIVWSVLGFVVAISVLVCFHEYGHYWMARRLGVKVLRFSLGWGRPIHSYVARDGVEWSIAPYPIGGYVKMLDEREGPVPEHLKPLAFNNQTPARRMAILAAGPAFNFILAIFLYWVVFVMGVPGMRPLIGEPLPDSAAARAGLQAGQEIVAIDGKPIPTWSVLSTELIDHALGRGQLTLSVRTAGGDQENRTLDLSQVRVDPDFLFADLGLQPYQPAIPAVLAEITPNSAAAEGGFEVGDRLLARDGQPITSWQDWAGWVVAHPGVMADIQIERDGRTENLSVTIGHNPDDETRGLFGASIQVPAELWQDLRAEQRLGPLQAVPTAVAHTWQMSQLTLRMLWRIILGEVSVKNVSGPIQIAQVAGDTAQVGLVSFLSFMAIVSISLGVLNLLPVPLLDGGHLVMYGIEWMRGVPLSERVQATSQYVGFAFIGMLMILAFFNDIMRLI